MPAVLIAYTALAIYWSVALTCNILESFALLRFAPPRAVTRLCKEQLDKVASQGAAWGIKAVPPRESDERA